MKKKGNILLVLLIIACVAVFYGYRTLDTMRTDNDAPVIYMDAQIPEVSVKDPKSALLQGISAEDERDGDVTSSLVVEKVEMTDSDGTLTVSFAAFDRSGNVAKEKREAKYTDYESPKFVMRAPLLFRNGQHTRAPGDRQRSRAEHHRQYNRQHEGGNSFLHSDLLLSAGSVNRFLTEPEGDMNFLRLFRQPFGKRSLIHSSISSPNSRSMSALARRSRVDTVFSERLSAFAISLIRIS